MTCPGIESVFKKSDVNVLQKPIIYVFILFPAVKRLALGNFQQRGKIQYQFKELKVSGNCISSSGKDGNEERFLSSYQMKRETADQIG